MAAEAPKEWSEVMGAQLDKDGLQVGPWVWVTIVSGLC